MEFMTAVVREAKGAVSRADLADVEKYAQTDFLLDLVRGEADTDATQRIADKFAAFTGVDQALSRRLAGRFDPIEFRRELDRRDGKVRGRYDASISGLDPYPDSSFYHFGDPSSDPLVAPLTSAAVDLTTRQLNWRPDGSYRLFNQGVEKAWNFGRGINPPDSIGELRQLLALDPKLKLLVAHGLFDLATPYFGSKIVLDQLPAYATSDRVKLVVYPGGHMIDHPSLTPCTRYTGRRSRKTREIVIARRAPASRANFWNPSKAERGEDVLRRAPLTRWSRR